MSEFVKPYNDDPFVGNLSTVVTTSTATKLYLGNLPIYRRGLSPRYQTGSRPEITGPDHRGPPRHLPWPCPLWWRRYRREPGRCHAVDRGSHRWNGKLLLRYSAFLHLNRTARAGKEGERYGTHLRPHARWTLDRRTRKWAMPEWQSDFLLKA